MPSPADSAVSVLDLHVCRVHAGILRLARPCSTTSNRCPASSLLGVGAIACGTRPSRTVNERDAPAPWGAHHQDGCAYPFHGLLAGRQTQAGATEPAGRGGANLREDRDELADRRLQEACCRVTRLELERHDLSLARHRRNVDRNFTAVRELDRVAHQVREHLAQSHLGTRHAHGYVVIDHADQLNLGLRLEGEENDRIVDVRTRSNSTGSMSSFPAPSRPRARGPTR